jgi:hypothetical protein
MMLAMLVFLLLSNAVSHFKLWGCFGRFFPPLGITGSIV